MNKRIPILVSFSFIALLTVGAVFVLSQDRTKQEVSVTAVEVPVRVLVKGEPVKGLTKDDFEVFENGIRQTVTSCDIVARKITLDKTVDAEALKIPPKPRLFLLIFNIFDYNQTVGEGIDYFFQTVYRPKDQLLLVTEDKVINVEKDDDAARIANRIKEALKTYKAFSTSSSLKAFADLGMEGEKVILYLQGMAHEAPGSWEVYINQFFDLYTRIWTEYKRRFFTLDVDLYQSLARRIELEPGDKWAICFEQRDMFPVLKKEGTLESELRKKMDSLTEPQDQAKIRLIQNKQRDLQKSMDITAEFPSDKLRDAFMASGITFHLVTMKSTRQVFARDFEMREVGQEYEDLFRQISKATGGYSTFSNNILDAVKEASVVEDYHYIVVYNPQDKSPGKERKIEVKVRTEGADVISLKQYIAKAQPLIRITGFQSGSKRIKFSLTNYTRTSTEGRLHGAADVRIVIFDDKSAQVFSDKKTLDLIKGETTISLSFNQLNAGSYFIIIDVYDRLTMGKDVYSAAIRL